MKRSSYHFLWLFQISFRLSMISYSLKFYIKENEFVTFLWVIFSYWLLCCLRAVLWVKRGTRHRHWHFSRKQQSTNLWSPVFMCPSWRKNWDLKTQRIIEQNLELSAHAKVYLSFPANSTHILFFSRAIADSCWHCEHLFCWDFSLQSHWYLFTTRNTNLFCDLSADLKWWFMFTLFETMVCQLASLVACVPIMTQRNRQCMFHMSWSVLVICYCCTNIDHLLQEPSETNRVISFI